MPGIGASWMLVLKALLGLSAISFPLLILHILLLDVCYCTGKHSEITYQLGLSLVPCISNTAILQLFYTYSLI